MLHKTPLESWHLAHKATMTDFNGWNMPLYYQGMLAEHHHTRTKVGIFDLGHMGRVRISGDGAFEFVQWITPANLETARVGDVLYSFLLRENGTVIDDITIYIESPESFLLVVNAGNAARVLDWLKVQQSKWDRGSVAIHDESQSLGMIALQGPLSMAVMQVLFGENADYPAYYRFTVWHDTVKPGPLIISRTGYTGEDGFELYPTQDALLPLWEALLGCCPEAEVRPIGLGARDSLRLEACMPLYGHELTDEITPLDAGLARFVTQNRGFLGKGALSSPSRRVQIAYSIDARGPIPRQGAPLALSNASEPVGQVTSGIFSPTLQKVIGLASVDRALCESQGGIPKKGTVIFPEVRGQRIEATVVARPFYKRTN
jgi:aminomethyltransferase